MDGIVGVLPMDDIVRVLVLVLLLDGVRKILLIMSYSSYIIDR